MAGFRQKDFGVISQIKAASLIFVFTMFLTIDWDKNKYLIHFSIWIILILKFVTDLENKYIDLGRKR